MTHVKLLAMLPMAGTLGLFQEVVKVSAFFYRGVLAQPPRYFTPRQLTMPPVAENIPPSPIVDPPPEQIRKFGTIKFGNNLRWGMTAQELLCLGG